MTVASLIATRLERMSMKPPQLHAELIRRDIKISRQSVHAWCTGTQRPSPEHVLLLWEALVVPPEERPAWMEALAKPLAKPAPAKASNRPEPDAA